MEQGSTVAVAERPLRRFGVGLFVALLIMVTLAGFVAWNNGLRDLVFARNFGVVEPGKLYRSGQISARLIEPTLRKYGIKNIVSLAQDGMKPGDLEGEEQAAERLGIERTVFPLSGDGTGRLEEYARAVAAIDRSIRDGKPVLVHCVAGAQRTGGVIAAYQLLVEHKSADEAFAEMKRFGHDPHDNPHLLDYLNNHMMDLARRLVEMGVIDRVPDPMPVVHAE